MKSRLKITPLSYTIGGKWKATWFVSKITSLGVYRVAEFDDLFEALQYCSNSGYEVEIDRRIL